VVVNARVGRFALPSSTAMPPQSDEPRAGSRRFVVIASALLVYHYHDLSTRRFGPPLCATGRRPRAAAGNSPRPRHAALDRLGREPGKIRRHDIRQLQQERSSVQTESWKTHRSRTAEVPYRQRFKQGWLVDQGPRRHCQLSCPWYARCVGGAAARVGRSFARLLCCPALTERGRKKAPWVR